MRPPMKKPIPPMVPPMRTDPDRGPYREPTSFTIRSKLNEMADGGVRRGEE